MKEILQRYEFKGIAYNTGRDIDLYKYRKEKSSRNS